MNLLPEPYAFLAKPVMYLVAAAAIAGFSAYHMHKHDMVQYDSLRVEYATYKGGVEALGREAAKDAANKDMWNELNWRKANAEIKAGRDLARARAERLRDDIASRGVLPEAGADRGGLEGARVDWPSAERALEDFAGEAARIAEEGDSAIAVLDALKRKAQKGSAP